MIYKKYINTVIIFQLLIGISFITSCKKTPEEIKELALKQAVDANLGKELLLPNKLQTYAPFTDYKADSSQIANADFKIYSHINTSCSTCVENMEKWNNLAISFSKKNVPVVLVCTSKDNFELIKYLCENDEIKTFPYPFFLDGDKEYMSQNKFMKQAAHFETVLTDKNNKILLMGNPTHSENIYNLYVNEIKKRTLKKPSKGEPVVVSGGKSK